MAPFIFNKTEQSYWEIVEEEVNEQAPELYQILDSVNDFKPNPDKEIKRYVFTTFHQSFAYEDFIEGIKPIMPIDGEETGDLNYKIESGIFKKLCRDAENDPENHYAIFIDEINRGNVSQIFGELITLIEPDKRKGAENEMTATLPYSKRLFSVPSNVDIYGTMNTADRSVEALDTALRRRFSFIEMPPVPSLIKTEGKLKDHNGIVGDIDLVQLLETINRRIEKLVDKDHMIGHSYFLSVAGLSDLKSAFQNKIIPLLQEYFFGDYGKIGLVLGSDFFVELENETQDDFFAAFNDYDDSSLIEKPVYHLKNISEMSDSVFTAAINTLLRNKSEEEN
jgi:5-methylcytosine-specific restriction protein B